VDHRKTVEARIIKFSPYDSLISLVLRGKFRPEILRGSPRTGASNKGGVGKISSLSLSLNISKTVADTAKVTINDCEFVVEGKPMEFVASYSHLEHLITDGLDDSCDISHRRYDFVGQVTFYVIFKNNVPT